MFEHNMKVLMDDIVNLCSFLYFFLLLHQNHLCFLHLIYFPQNHFKFQEQNFKCILQTCLGMDTKAGK